jgi:hypothetical protein
VPPVSARQPEASPLITPLAAKFAPEAMICPGPV